MQINADKRRTCSIGDDTGGKGGGLIGGAKPQTKGTGCLGGVTQGLTWESMRGAARCSVVKGGSEWEQLAGLGVESEGIREVRC